MSDEASDLYVSSVQGHLVSRPGSPTVLIGAARDIREPSKIVWNTEQVVRIPESEHRAFLREYTRALRGGALVKRSKADFDAWVKREAELATKEAEEADKRAKAEAKAKADAEKSGKKE